jgi:DMSO reductase family type II enzyme chaperone
MRKLVHEVGGLEGAKEVGTSARSQLYLLLSTSFQVPDDEFYSDVRSGKFRTWILEAIEKSPYELDVKRSVELLTAEVDYEDFNSEFMRLFEVGSLSPPCPLNESDYLGSQMGLFKELVSFYNFFDLSVSKAKEFPDHLRIELDFMHFLTFKEVEAVHGGRETESFARAGRDFLDRHLGRWAPLLCQRVKDSEGLEFFQGLTGLLETFVSYEAKFLNQRLALDSG